MKSQRKPKLTLGLRLMMSMHAKELTSGAMAELLHVSRPSVSGWLYGRHAPNHATLEKWASICDVSEDWLINGEPEEAPEEGLSREQLAQLLVEQLLGDNRVHLPVSLAERDLAPAYIDLTREPAPVYELAATGS